MIDQDKINELMQRLQENGVATAKVDDGRIILFSVEVLEKLLTKARDSGSGHCSVFIKDSESLN